MSTTLCPTSAQLADFEVGKLSNVELESVAVHLEGCPVCQALLADLASSGDSLVRDLRQHPGADTFASEPACHQAIARVESLVDTASATCDPITSHDTVADLSLRMLGKYQLLEPIGQGGMGTVYKAVHTLLKRTVALKVLLPNRLNNPQAVVRFRREVEAAGRLVHPHIVHTSDAGEADGQHFLVMEWLAGQDLGQHVRERGPLPVAVACDFIRQAALGLDYAHRNGLVHRDVKPSNLLLTTTEDHQPLVKVLDLGLALISDALPGDGDITSTGQVMGTYDYIAPEQAMESHAVDARADIYSLGCTFYFFLTGQAPFPGASVTKKLLDHQLEQPRPVAQFRNDVPEEVIAVLTRMMAKDPAQRYASASEVASVLARIGCLPPKRTKPAPRRRPLIAAALILLCGLLAWGAWAMLPVRISTEQGDYLIETDDPDIAFRVAKDGVLLEDRKTKREYRLKVVSNDRPGELVLDVREVGGDLAFTTPTFTIQRGEQVALRASFVRKAGVPAIERLTVAPVVVEVPHVPVKPIDADWVKQVGKMTAAKQVDAVVAKLKDVNPGVEFRPAVHYTTGVEVSGLILVRTAGVLTDLSPVQALTALENFGVHMNQTKVPRGEVLDLSPLKSLRLTSLVCTSTAVNDLSPLRGMGLTSLGCAGTLVTDLTPLKGMPLTDLDCIDTRVADLTSLKGMALKYLRCDRSKVSDLTPLAGMPLENLGLGGTGISDLTPLKGMPLKSLRIGNTVVADLTPLKGLSLTSLDCSDTRVSDLTPIAGQPIREIHISKSRVADLSPLIDMPLVTLTCDFRAGRDTEIVRAIKTLQTMNGKPIAEFWKSVDAQPAFEEWVEQVGKMNPEKQLEAVLARLKEVNPGLEFRQGGNRPGKTEVTQLQIVKTTGKLIDLSPIQALTQLTNLSIQGNPTRLAADDVLDLTPLKSLRLTNLTCSAVAVRDLAPLRGMKLTSLDCSRTLVTDLSPLQGMPLTSLTCFAARITDLTPLKGMPLKSLNCDQNKVADLTPLRGMPLTSLHVADTLVEDLIPLKGMPLSSIYFSKTIVSDLTPLKGMSLVTVVAHQSRVADLTPLADQPIKELFVNDSRVVDLSVLKTMKLTMLTCDFQPDRDAEILRSIASLQHINGKPVAEFWKSVAAQPAAEEWLKKTRELPAKLQIEAVDARMKELNPGFEGIKNPAIMKGEVSILDLNANSVKDISPLRAFAHLQILDLRAGPIPPTIKGNRPSSLKDLSPLQGLPIRILRMAGLSVEDLSPLKGMQLRHLSVDYCKVTDLSPLQGMKLTYFSCRDTNVSNLEALQGMPVEKMDCQHSLVTDLAPLKGMPLTELTLDSTAVSDLSPLAGTTLKSLHCGRTKISDLTPLKGLPLLSLNCEQTNVSDLAALAGMRLQNLHCSVTRVTDLSPLKGMPLVTLSCDFRASRDAEILRPIKTLKSINGKPSEEFWKAVDQKP